jgi:hypothetical protein
MAPLPAKSVDQVDQVEVLVELVEAIMQVVPEVPHKVITAEATLDKVVLAQPAGAAAPGLQERLLCLV